MRLYGALGQCSIARAQSGDAFGKRLVSSLIRRQNRADLRVAGRQPGEPPPTLFDYLPPDALLVVDESHVTVPQLAILLPSVIVGLLLAVWTIKPLNLLLFGEEYAVTMGLNIRRSRGLLFLSTTLLAGTVTAFCGPIGFIGLAMPHVARMLFREADHRVLLPGTLLSGAAVLLLCDIVSKMFTLPVNAITALLGIPIVVWVVLRNKSMTV